jgi:hypothetical protein
MPRFYVRGMKRFLVSLIVLLAVTLVVRAQDAATEEQLNKLRSELSALQSSNVELQKRVTELSRELSEVREAASRPAGNFASSDDVKVLADKLREVDRNREADRELILKQIEKLGKTVSAQPKHTNQASGGSAGGGEKPAANDKGYEYVIKAGDNLSGVVAAYREKGVKVTTDQVLKANPGLKANSLKVGQKIFIPEPGQ